MRALNLAQHPFRNERLAATLFAVASAVLVGVTLWHVVAIRNLLPARTSERHREVEALETELTRLRDEARTLKTETPPAATLAQWNLVKELVDRRSFSWTGLFARLEQLMPQGVRLTSISPSVVKGQVELDVEAAVRSREAGWEFVRVLEDGGDFHDVYPKSENGNEFRYGIRYRPQNRPSVTGPPAPPAVAGAEAPPAGAAESASDPAPAEADTHPAAPPVPAKTRRNDRRVQGLE